MRRVGRWVASSEFVRDSLITFIILVHTRICIMTTLKCSALLACGSRKIAGTSARQGQRRVGKWTEARRWRSNALSGDLHRSYRLLDWNRRTHTHTHTRESSGARRPARRATGRWALHTSPPAQAHCRQQTARGRCESMSNSKRCSTDWCSRGCGWSARERDSDYWLVLRMELTRWESSESRSSATLRVQVRESLTRESWVRHTPDETRIWDTETE